MDLIDRLRELAARKATQIEHLQTEEATKNALVMPFIDALGYNVFNPMEVMPEYTADVGTKKGEKVDYAIMREGKPIMLFECKCAHSDLDKEHTSQLYRYFSVTDARFGVLTNGVVYKFFSDLEEPNKMDSRPFLEFNMFDFSEEVVEELKKFAKESFDLDNILSTASDLKFTKGIKRILAEEWTNPSEHFVRLLTGRVYSGHKTQAVVDQFTQITKRAFHEFVSDRVKERLKSALERETDTEAAEDIAAGGENADMPAADVGKSKIVTTEEEIEGFYIVKSIVREVVDAKRVFMRDTIRYCGILLDDTNRKPICRLWFNSPQNKYLGIFAENKEETKHVLKDVSDIYRFADELKKRVLLYDSGPPD
ncbi:MAG: type I restriction enzyme HsdR N-terminal domain-containing protein [Planctomycetes bacterium]|nr:type I restriction enzyme HsdR N-terminal domain-containing protein [Planctomycetota bacterium]